MEGMREGLSELTDDQRRYVDALHGMQSGVAMMMNYEPAATEPKHLRVGVNSAIIANSALVSILVAKGLLTEDEWFAALASAAEDERDRYEAAVRDAVGAQPGQEIHLR